MVMRKVWLQYLCMFLVALIGAASFTILTFTKEEGAPASAIGKVLDTVMTARDAKANYNLSLEFDQTKLNADGDFVLEIDKQTGALSFDFNMKLNINGKDNTVKLTYSDDIVYINYNEANLKFALKDTLSNISDITTLLSPILSQIDLPFDTESFSMSNLQGLATKATETETKGGFKIEFPLYLIQPDLGIAVIEANKDYQPTNIYIKPYEDTQEGKKFNLSFGAVTDFVTDNPKIEADEQQKEFTDISKTMELVNLVMSRATDNNLLLNIKAENDDFSIAGTAKLSLIPLNVELELSGFWADTSISFKDNKIFLNTMGIKIKTELEYLTKLLNLDKNIFDFDIQKLAGIFKSIKDLSTISLDNLIKITQIEDSITQTSKKIISLTIENYQIDFISDENNKLQKVEVYENSILFAELAFSDEEFEFKEIIEDEYVGLDIVANKIDFFKELLSTKKFSTDVMLKTDTLNLDFNASFDFSSQPKVVLKTQILDSDLTLSFLDNTIFVSYKNINLSATCEDILSLAYALEPYLPQEINIKEILEKAQKFISQDIQEIIDYIDFKNFKLSDYISQIKLSNNQFVFNLSDNNSIEINFEENNLSNVIANFNDLKAELSLNITPYLNIDVDRTKFVKLVDIMPVLNFADNIIKNKCLSGTIALNINNHQFDANFKLDLNKEYFELNTAIFQKEISIIILGQNVYVSTMGVNLTGNLNDLLAMLPTTELPVPDDLLAFASKMLNEIKSLTFSENKLELILNEFKLSITNNNGNLSKIQGDFKDIKFALSNLTFDVQQADINPENFVEVSKVLKLTENLKNFLTQKTYALNASINFNNQTYNANILLDIKDTIKAQVKTEYQSKDITVTLIGKDIYISVDKYNVHGNLDDITKILDVLSKYITIDKEFILSIIDEISKYTQSPYSKIESLIQNKLENVSAPTFDEILDMLTSSLPFNLALDEMGNIITLSGSYENHFATITFKDYNLNSISYQNDLYVDINIMPFEEIVVENKTYIEISNILKLYDAVSSLIETPSIKGSGIISFEFMGEQNIFEISYGVKYLDGNLQAFLHTTFKGLSVEIVIIKDNIFVDLAGMKFTFSLENLDELIAWANSSLNLNIDTSDLNFGNIIGTSNLDIMDIIFNQISKLEITNNSAHLIYDNLDLTISFSNIIDELNINYSGIVANLNTDAMQNFEISVDETLYSDYKVVTNAIDNLIATINQKQFDLNVNFDIFENEVLSQSGTGNIVIDALNSLAVSAKLNITGNNQTSNIIANFLNDYLYLDYDGFKAKASKQSLKELIIIALQALGIDPNSIKILGAIDDEFNIDMENLSGFMPNLDLGNPLNMLNMIKKITLTNSTFEILLDGQKISTLAGQVDMLASIQFEENKIKRIVLNDIYTNETTHFNLTLDVCEFTQVPTLENEEKYIDISGASQILKSLINTTALKDYHIQGTISAKINVIGIKFDMNISVDAQIKNIDGKIYGIISMPDIPVIGSNVPGFTGINVNNDVPYKSPDTSVESRKLTIYLADDYVYFYRYDKVKQTVFSSRTYEKKLKVSAEQLMADPLYYILQYGFGFSEKIMSEIEKAMEKTLNRTTPIDPSNVLLGYENNNNNSHKITLNMYELSANEQLDKAEITLETTNTAQTKNKDYLYKLLFSLYMPLASGVELTLATNDLTLVDIGNEVNMQNALDFANNYNYDENAEYEASNGSWNKANMASYTIYFEENGGTQIADITDKCGMQIILPIITKPTFDDGITRTIYTFDGWYKNSDFSGEPLTSVSIPRGDTLLYAKWTESTNYYHTISFNSDFQTFENITKLGGEELSLPQPTIHKVTNGNATTTYKFIGWFTESTFENLFNSSIMTHSNTVLFARWDIESVETTVLLKIIDNGTTVFEDNLVAGRVLELPSTIKVDEDTKFYTEQNFVNEFNLGNIVPEKDTVLYIKNAYNLKVVSDYGNITNLSVTVYQNEDITGYIPKQSYYEIDNYAVKKTFYTFNGYSNNSTTMTNSDLTITANWTVVEKNYYKIILNTKTTGLSNTADKGVTIYGEQIALQDSIFDLSPFKPTCSYRWGIWYHCDFKHWEINGTQTTTFVVTGNTQVNAVWGTPLAGRS